MREMVEMGDKAEGRDMHNNSKIAQTDKMRHCISVMCVQNLQSVNSIKINQQKKIKVTKNIKNGRVPYLMA